MLEMDLLLNSIKGSNYGNGSGSEGNWRGDLREEEEMGNREGEGIERGTEVEEKREEEMIQNYSCFNCITVAYLYCWFARD